MTVSTVCIADPQHINNDFQLVVYYQDVSMIFWIQFFHDQCCIFLSLLLDI
jgi:hypothetical protein